MNTRLLLAGCCLSFALPAALVADEVFVTRGANGPVFSDRPQPGARPVTLPPLNVIEPVPIGRPPSPASATPGDAAGKGEEAAASYRRLAITFPEDGGAVVANTALFEVRLAVEPRLQLGEGHAFVVAINGRPVEQRFTASEFMIPPEFWGDTLPPANQFHQLDAAIIDHAGRVLLRARPVTFQLRHASIAPRQWQRPQPPIEVKPPRPPAGSQRPRPPAGLQPSSPLPAPLVHPGVPSPLPSARPLANTPEPPPPAVVHPGLPPPMPQPGWPSR
ncbi:MAG: hypothetical protein AW08_00813 [Candidatus Accumulibacter adjunctus]|uniref:DUF4124 domain-containing protein n=1 Tax=Candidatus Accumulibacter adjunctus TaxID=1454001 RepID=A0A011NWJ8_9PROT|nr:MAG: hypothetical protein AW08_00813 [Candidatus Accumulibacter adjunctus]